MSWLERLEKKSFEWNTLPDDGFIPAYASDGALYARDGLGLDANVVMSPVNWITANFAAAPTIVEAKRDDVWRPVEDHALHRLLRRPNPYYGGRTLWKASLVSILLDGNGYWQKVRNGFGDVLGFWYLPHFLVEPIRPEDGSEFVSYYRYQGPGTVARVFLPRDIVHFRCDGLDPRNTLKGMSKLRPLLKEVLTDEEASGFAAHILRNMGVPGGVIAPKTKDALPSKDEAQRMKDYMKGNFTGRNRGEWLVLGTPTEIAQFGFDPNQLMLGSLRDIAEERVTAALNVPAAVVGFGAGLQQTKVGATMRELRQQAQVSCISPLQLDCAETIDMQVLPDFVGQPNRFRVRFDQDAAPAFQEERTERAKYVTLLVEKGVLRVDRAQEMLGLEVDPSQALYLRPSSVTPVEEGDPGIEEDPDQQLLQDVAARLNGRNGSNTSGRVNNNARL